MDDAAAQLNSLPKPLVCGAALDGEGVIEVRCGPVEPSHAFSVEIARRQVNGGEFVGPVPRALVTAGEASIILVVSGTTELRITPPALEIWLSDYILTNNYGLSGDEPDPASLARGIDWIVHLHPGGAGDDDPASLDELPAAIRADILRQLKATP